MSRASRSARTESTVRLDWLMDQAQRLEIAERITELRIRSPYKQPYMARKLGYESVRGYQKLEQKGTTDFERCEEIAEIHSAWTEDSDDYAFMTASWIYSGKKRTVPTAEDFAKLNGHGETSEASDLDKALDLLEATQSDLDAQAGEIADMQQKLDVLLLRTEPGASGP